MSEPSPFAQEKPKRKNVVVGLYDLPLYRDGAAWSGAVWFVLSIVIYSTADIKDGTPRWVTIPVGTAILVLLFSLIPALVRRWFRKWRLNRRRTATSVGVDSAHLAGTQATDTFGSHREPSAPFVGLPPASWGSPPPVSQDSMPLSSASPTEEIDKHLVGPAAPVQPVTPPNPAAARRPEAAMARPALGLPRVPQLPPAVDANRAVVLADARVRMPHPVARAVRSIEVASNPREEYDAVLRASEVLTIVLGVMAVGAYRDAGAEPPEFEQLRQAYLNQGVSQGHWLAAMKAVDKLIPQKGERLPGIATAFRRGKKGSGLFADLDALVQERNRWAHGAAPRSFSEAKARMDELRPVFIDALGHASFASNVQWILTRSTSYRRETNDFRVSALDATGDHPDFECRQFASATPLADETFYMLAADGPRELSPFIVMHDCPECRQEEICYSDRLDRRYGVSLKSFASGHSMYEPDLNAELEQLFAVR